MGERPAAIHIDDLAEPRFPPEMQELFDGASAMADAVELKADAICARASADLMCSRYCCRCAGSPCEKLIRNMSTPDAISCATRSGEPEAGPIVATIFVRLRRPTGC